MTKIVSNENLGWINVVENGVINNGICEVDKKLKEIILAADEDSILFFPRGNYLFKEGININKRLTLVGESNYYGDSLDSLADTTNFITKGVPDISIIRMTGANQCMKNINFYSDSCVMEENQSAPADGEVKYRHVLKVKHENVSAISNGTGTQGLSRFEHLYICGFSKSGIEIPYSSNANNIIVDTCGLGIQAGADVILTDSRVSRCKNGLEIATGVNLNNVRVEKIQEVGINNIGTGSNLIMNLLVDQCGCCGIQFQSMSDSRIAGRFTRCCQSYYSVSWDAYEGMDNRKEEAYSLFYGEHMNNCNIELMNHNACDWDNEEDAKHRIYVIKANETANVFLKCDARTDEFIQDAKGDLLFEHSSNTYKYQDGEICSIGGVQISDKAKGDYLSLKDGIINVPGKKNDIKIITLPVNTVLTSMTDSALELEKAHGGVWENIGSKVMSGQTIYYFKKISR